MAPGSGGTLFVSVPRPGGSVLALLDHSGRPRPGWPVDLGDHGVQGYSAGRMIGDELIVDAWATLGDAREAGIAWIMTTSPLN